MSAPRAEKKAETHTLPGQPTTYEISVRIDKKDDGGEIAAGAHAWQPQGEVTTNRGAEHAIRLWAERNPDFPGGTLRGVPMSRITERSILVETKRQLTLGTPAS